MILQSIQHEILLNEINAIQSVPSIISQETGFGYISRNWIRNISENLTTLQFGNVKNLKQQ